LAGGELLTPAEEIPPMQEGNITVEEVEETLGDAPREGEGRALLTQAPPLGARVRVAPAP
jgi:hypothetical protein